MFEIKRMFSTGHVKGTLNYINSQKKYELLRTFIYFALPIGLFITGFVSTGKKENLLTVVAVVGCLPACKSLIGAIMFLRYHSCPKDCIDKIEEHIGSLQGLYDMVFTSYQKNFVISHLVVQGSNICCYSTTPDFPENDFQVHMEGILKADGHTNYSIKIFTDIKKYTDRLNQLNELEAENKNISSLLETLKSVAL